ncbi:DUF4260 family protein [Leucobacter luti]|uniref:Uncharacterized protein DUF4260 n=1 Tax=Leucobacter luti TaxID=340320 RepID=A0A4V3CXH3_9MICO|nr:DUF4260 family protein [Leucobacter luti]MCW2288000.1 hypothetical protein [Leucobacter luti]QYM76010.1 DUF4260 domain-containing protein [Leucobacter luti]TCK45838.1 uncharacterized protein DUF4260 [Leucobacter luti]TDP90268.1 uncharacterized protein DUF4260 [Leucobacter luti]
MVFSRAMWGMSALVWVVVAVLWCVWWGWPAIFVVVVFGLLPDVALVGAFAERGKLKPSRVSFYNALHNVAVPAALILVGFVVLFVTGGIATGSWGIALAGLAWFVHIAADRALGFGLRAADGSIIPVR